MRQKTLLLFVLAVALAILAGWVDLTASELQSEVLVILAGGFVLGVLGPKGAWRWALILGLSAAAAEWLALGLGIEPAGFAHARAANPGRVFTFTYVNALQAFFALVPAFTAAYMGAWASRLTYSLLHPVPLGEGK
jgi:hypothetical protein